METIITTDRYVIIDGTAIPKNSVTVSRIRGGVRINGTNIGIHDIQMSVVSLNGETYDDLETFFIAINESFFVDGGGNGNGVTSNELNEALSNKADLVNSKVPESQLPSYIDNVQEYGTVGELPSPGADNVIYVTTDTNKVYRWSGTGFVEVAQSISLGETSATAYPGDKGAAAFAHISASNNPHNVTKAQLGLDKINNTSDAEKEVSSPQATAILTREPLITPSTANHYFSGDKSWKLLTKASVQLDRVDNTPDLEKPLTQDMLNAFGVKADLLNGKVPASQLPSYVDNVQEMANLAAFPSTGMSNVIYLALDTNKPYRWGGSSYIEISASVALGETPSTAYRGDRGKLAYDHSIATGNPHGTTAASIGLDLVNNTADIDKEISNPTKSALALKQNYPTVNSSIGTRNASGNQGSVPYTSSPTINTLPVRNAFGTFQVAEPISAPDVATKNYVDSASGGALISNTVANNVRFKDFTDRREYTAKYSITNHSVPTNNVNYVTTNCILPVGVTMSAADEMYINVRCQNAAIHVNVFDDPTSRAIRMSFDNTYTPGASSSAIVLFLKLVFYK